MPKHTTSTGVGGGSRLRWSGGFIGNVVASQVFAGPGTPMLANGCRTYGGSPGITATNASQGCLVADLDGGVKHAAGTKLGRSTPYYACTS